jgi:predicted lipase
MLYLSQLIYDYHNNELFNLSPDQTILEFVQYVQNKLIDEDVFDNIIQPLDYLSKISPNAKLIKFISDDKTDTQVGIIKDDINKNLVIVFRGTESFKDCLTDINFYEKKYKNFRVHAGFYNQVKSVKNEIIKLINPYINLYNIYLTGHSLGSANATLLTYLLSEKYPDKPLKLITFGGPRVGNYQWKQSFDNKTNIDHYRITNKRDIVTVIPTINYYHVGTHIYLDETNLYCVQDNTYYSLYCRSIFHSFNVNDHKILNYANNLINKEHLWNQLDDNDDYSESSDE